MEKTRAHTSGPSPDTVKRLRCPCSLFHSRKKRENFLMIICIWSLLNIYIQRCKHLCSLSWSNYNHPRLTNTTTLNDDAFCLLHLRIHSLLFFHNWFLLFSIFSLLTPNFSNSSWLLYSLSQFAIENVLTLGGTVFSSRKPSKHQLWVQTLKVVFPCLDKPVRSDILI